MSKIKNPALILTIALLSILIAGCGGANSNNSNNSNHTGAANTNTTANANETTSTSNANNANTGGISLPDLDKVKEEIKKAGSKVGDKAEDAAIWSQLRLAFTADSELRNVKIDVENGAVTLSGTVASKAQSDKAEQKAKGVSGVKSVTNNIQVSGS